MILAAWTGTPGTAAAGRNTRPPRASLYRARKNDHSLAVMDIADQIVVLTALEITTIKNVRLFLEVADQLDSSDSQAVRRRE